MNRSLEALAIKCRRLSGFIVDQQASDALERLADQYEQQLYLKAANEADLRARELLEQ